MFEDKPLKSLLLEVASIVLGVLLALAVNEWQQDREKAELAHTALTNIASELAANAAILESIHDNNVSTIDAVNAAAGSEEDPADDEDWFAVSWVYTYLRMQPSLVVPTTTRTTGETK